MKIFKFDANKHTGSIVEFFMPESTCRDNVQIGSAVMKGHTSSDWSIHKGDEYSYVVSGELICYADESYYKVKAGDAMFIPAGQKHKSECISDEDCLCVWIEVAI